MSGPRQGSAEHRTPWLVKLRLAANLCRVCINQLQKGAKDNGQVRFFPCGDKFDPDIIWLQTVEPDTMQLAEVVRRFDLGRLAKPFSRCLRCNTLLEQAGKDQVHHQLPARIALLHDEFLRCPDCGRAYWKGGHFRRMRQWIDASMRAWVVAR